MKTTENHMKTTENRKTDLLAAAGDYLTVWDYKEAAKRLDAAFDASGLKSVTRGGYLTTDDTGWKHYAWSVEFFGCGTPRVAFDWKAGSGHVDALKRPRKPNPAEVLGRCCGDFISADRERFENWASDLGYDPDSRKAERIYQDCLDLGRKLERLGLSRQEIEALGALADQL